jgi:streptogramin lyase
MVRRQALILSVVLLLKSVCAMACTGPTPTPTPHFIKEGESIHTVGVAPDGTVWVSIREYGEENFVTPVSHGVGVAHFDGQTWTTYISEGDLAGKGVGAIVVTPAGEVWFDTSDGPTRFAGGTWTTYTAQDGLAEGSVVAIAVAPDGAVWVGTSGNGISRFDGETWTTCTSELGLPEDLVKEVSMKEMGI